MSVTNQPGGGKTVASKRLIKRLGSTDKHQREKALRKLRKLLKNHNLTPVVMLKLWQGLFECFWLSDKLLVQQQLAKQLADILLELKPLTAFLYLDACLTTLRMKWSKIDSERRDKFIDLLGQFLRGAYAYVARAGWDHHTSVPIGEIIERACEKGPLNFGMDLLFSNLDKLRQVAMEYDPPPIKVLQALLKPVFTLCCSEEKFLAWKATQFFQDLYDTIDPKEDSDGEEEELPNWLPPAPPGLELLATPQEKTTTNPADAPPPVIPVNPPAGSEAAAGEEEAEGEEADPNAPQPDPFKLRDAGQKSLSEKFREMAVDPEAEIHPWMRKNLHKLKKLFDPAEAEVTEVDGSECIKPPSRKRKRWEKRRIWKLVRKKGKRTF